MKDFYTPFMKPSPRHEIWATRVISVLIGFLPIPFALVVPGMIKTFFFARALRTTITVLLLFMIYVPHIARKQAGLIALGLGVLGTIVWFLLGNPWGIDNMYVALVTPIVVILIDHAIGKAGGHRTKTPSDGRQCEQDEQNKILRTEASVD
jgi:SSS family solute:Na+ symporter